MCLLLAGCLPAQAQRHHEPLTQPEIDQIRDASWEPKQRLTLYVQFARARLVKLEQMRSDPKTKDRPRQTHDLLDDFQLLYDELNDNIDTYIDRKDDIRKPLKTGDRGRYRISGKAARAEGCGRCSGGGISAVRIRFGNILDSVDTAAEDHRKLLADQEEAAKHKKLNTNSSAKSAGKPE